MAGAGLTAEQVIDAAEDLLDAGGFDALSVRRVADRLGVSRQVVYTHFGGMDGLLDAVHQRMSARLTGAVEAAPGEAGTVEHLRSSTQAYVAAARRHPEPYQLLFEQPVPEHQPSVEAHAAARASFGRVIAAADAWLHGEVSSQPDDEATWNRDAVDLARVLWSAGHGFVVLERAGYATATETDRLVDRMVRSVLSGWPTD